MEFFVIISIIAISTLIAFFLAIRVVKSGDSILIKVFFITLLFIPVLGPFFFIWATNWPSKLPANLDGHGAGLGRRYIQETSSRSARTPSVMAKAEAEINEREDFERRKEVRKMRRAERWARIKGQKKV